MIARRRALGLLGVPCFNLQMGDRMFAGAEAYERFMGRWSRQLAPHFLKFAHCRGTEVLDAGCGTGALSSALAAEDREARVTGIDPSANYVSYASSRNPFPERVSFQTGDAQNLAFPENRFDACVSLLVVNFIPDAGRAVAEFRRVTRAGGAIAAAVWDYGEGMEMLRLFWDAASAMDPDAARLDEKKMKLCRAGELKQLWTGAGLSRVEERAIEIQTRFGSFADFWEPFLAGQGPAGAYVAGLESQKRRVLEKAVRLKVAPSHPDEPFELKARAWAVRGEKV